MCITQLRLLLLSDLLWGSTPMGRQSKSPHIIKLKNEDRRLSPCKAILMTAISQLAESCFPKKCISAMGQQT